MRADSFHKPFPSCAQATARSGAISRNDRPRPGNIGGFTLLEVVLAVVIATGMLAAVFYFYQQAAELRTQVLRESARVTAARLILERLTTELRTALPGTDLHSGLWGSSNHLEFVRLDAPITSSATGDTNTQARPLSPTLKKIQYRLNIAPDETNSAVLLRMEEPVMSMSSPETAMTNEVSELSTAIEVEPVPKGLVLTKEFQFVCFRFWSGTAWQDSWSADALPLGIEIKLGVESLPADTLPEDYPYDLFNRIISLPLAVPARPSGEQSPPEAHGVPNGLPKAAQRFSLGFCLPLITSSGSRSRRGFVLYSVLIMVLLCSMIAISLLFSMKAEQTAFSAGEQGEQAWAAALSGAHHAINVALTTPAGWLNWQDNPAEFHNQLVVNDGSDDWYFTVYQMNEKDEESVRYGLRDESSKLNLIHAPPGWTESSSSPILRLLQGNRTEETTEGSSNSFTLDLAMPRGLPATAPEVLDAYIAAARINSRVLFGKDLDLNLRPDPGTEETGEIFQQGVGSGLLGYGLRHFLTTVSYDRNVDSQNRPRIDLNSTNAGNLAELELPRATMRYLRQLRRSGQKLSHPADLLEAVTKFQNRSNRTVELSSEVKGEELAILLDRCTTTNAAALPGLININTAPHEVLTLLPGVNDSLADSIIATRQGLNADQLKTPAWLYQQGLLKAEEFKKIAPLITARSWQFHFHVVGYSIPSARYRVLEAVVDVAASPPQILSLRDLTRLGLPFKISTSSELETPGAALGSPQARAESTRLSL